VKIGIIGTGAVGGYYGALLAKNGLEVHFLLNTDFEHVRDNGLLVESKDGDFALDTVNAYSRSVDMPKCDIVIVALKTTHNDLLKSILPDMIKENGIIVMLQNGLNIEKEISVIVPSATVIGGLCFLCSHKIGPGHIRHLDYGSIRLGQYGKDDVAVGVTNELKLISDIFSKAGIPVHLSENLGRARWEKLVWNIGFNGPTVILNAATDLIVKNKSSCAMINEIMLEAIQGARACGYDISEEFSEIMLNVTKQMAGYSPSMKLDYDAGRPLEIENIYWRPINAAAEKGYDMTKTRILAYQLDFLDRVNRKIV
jgi:2-dehydropantoate 2-reductase